MTTTRPFIRRDWLPLGLFSFALALHSARLFLGPPGISGDSARLAIHALDFLRRNVWDFYVYILFAPNPLIIYLDAVTLSALGFNFFALCSIPLLSAALISPAAYLAARQLFADAGRDFARLAGLIAGVGLALSTAFGIFVSQGTEHVLLPLLELAAVAALWRALRLQRRADFIMAGVCIGVSQYAYIVARAFPVALAGALLAAALVPGSVLRRRWRGLVFTAAVAALLALPQWILFLRTPFTLFSRTEQTAGRFIFSMADPAALLIGKLANLLLMFGVQWDNSSHPGMPLLDPVLFFGLLAGLVVALRQRRAAQLFCVAIAALLYVPELLTFERMAPAPTRTLAALPFVFLLAGMGLAAIWQWVQARWQLPRRYALLMLGAVVLAGAARQWDYAARVTAALNKLPGREWDGSLVDMAQAEYILQNRNRTILVASSEYQRPPLAFLIADGFPERAGGLQPPLQPGELVTVITPAQPERPTTDGNPASYRQDEWVALKNGIAYLLPPLPDALEYTGAAQPLPAANGVLGATIRAARWRGLQPSHTPAAVAFSNGLSVNAYHSSTLTPAQPLTVTLYWQAQQRVTRDVQILTQLIDREGNALATAHTWPLHGVYRVVAWRAGETVPLTTTLKIPAGAAPGAYRLMAGVWDVLRQERVPVVGGEEMGTVGQLKIPLEQAARLPDNRLAAEFDDGIALTGYTLAPASAGLRLTLFWNVRAAPLADYSIFVHVVDAAGSIVAQADAQPMAGSYPTSIWSAGETVVDTIQLSVAPGDYQVYVGLYRWDTQARLQVKVAGAAVPDNRLSLGSVRLP